ncbi:MAG: hypothetical protein KA352_13315 [Flavobacteriales bacterium]|nr:hypothetical protein [Flavobacteriales bacterium]
MRPLSSSIVIACLLPLLAGAQGLIPATGEFRVNQNVPSDQYQPQIAVGPSDDYIVVWKSNLQDDNTASIYFRRYNSAHIAISTELLVATGSNYQEDYVVKAFYWSAGRFIIAWNTSNGLFMRVLEADNTLGAVVDLEGGQHWDLALRNNTLALLYGTGTAQLYVRGYDLGTNAFLGPAVLATENAADDYEMPNIRYKSDGSLVAIYARAYPSRIYRKTFDSDFLAQINETIVHDAPGISLSCIDVSTNASDEILISTKWGVNGTDVYTAWLLDANGNILLDELGVYSCAYAYYTAECALYDNGDFVIVMGNWLSLNDTEHYNVRGIYFHNYGQQSTGVVVMNTTLPQEQVYPAVEKRSDGGFVVVWQGNGFQGDTQGINARAYAGATFPGLQATSTATVVVDETGTTGTLGLRLGTQPIADVVVDLSVSDATEASIDVPQITFTAGNWDQPQTLTVTGLDDVIDDGDIDLSVVASMNVLTADPLYAAMGPEYFAVLNLDDDATFTMPLAQTFCRDIGMSGVNVLINNLGSPIIGVQATSSDQGIVHDADIAVTPVNSITYAVSITGLEDNAPGTCLIQVSATDGLFDYTDAFTVTTLGEVPVILQNGGDLASSTTGVSYQWFVDGGFIPAATAQTWTPQQNGDYTVLVVDADGCYNTSAPFTYVSTGNANGAIAAEDIHLYPMPVIAGAGLSITGLRSTDVAAVHAVDGRICAASWEGTGTNTLLRTGSLAPGSYVLRAKDGRAWRFAVK